MLMLLVRWRCLGLLLLLLLVLLLLVLLLRGCVTPDLIGKRSLIRTRTVLGVHMAARAID